MVALACALTTLFVGGALAARSFFRLRERVITDLTVQAEIVAANSAAPLAFDDREVAAETLNTLRAERQVAAAVLFDKEGMEFARFLQGERPLPDLAPGPHGWQLRDEWLIVSQATTHEESAVGTLVLAYDLTNLYARLRNDLLVSLALGLIAAAAALLLAARLQRVLSMPVAELARTAQQVSRTRDYSVRARKHADDELGRLTDGFNQMLARIQEQSAEIERSTGHLRVITDAMPALISYVDATQRYRFNNRAYEEWFGQPRTEIYGRHVRDVLGEAAYASVRPHIEAALAGQTEVFETEAPYKGVEPRQIVATYIPDRQADGTIAGLFALVVDITQRKRAEDALRESEARKAAILESVLECLVSMDHEGRIIDFNPASERTFGYSRDEAIGRTVAELLVPPRLRDAHWQGLRRYLQTGRGDVIGRRVEMQALRADGTEIPVELTISVVRLPNRPPFFTAYLRDITEQKQRHEERELLLESERSARTEAERASRMKDEFVATLSHELRTPLTAILGWAQILRRHESSLPAEAAQGLEIIERNARVQTRIIEDLLDVSRIISGKIRLDVQTVDLPQVIEAALATVRPAAEAKHIRIQTVIDPHVGPVRGDPNRLQQVVWNLLSNAIKFTGKDGRVEVALERVNSHVELSVGDTGQGISPDFLPHVFERFRQFDSSTTRKHAGLGLGLAIVKQLVELHGGSVRAKSPGEGKGATFVVHLPLPIAVAPASDDRQHPRMPSALPLDNGPVSLDGVRVLVVDDEPDARSLVARLLEQQGAQVDTAMSAAEALSQFVQSRPDVLVSDIGMPGQDGYDLVRRIRALPADQGGAVPAVALTAFARSEDRTRALLAGYQMHVAKPVEPSELVATVASLAGITGNRADPTQLQ